VQTASATSSRYDIAKNCFLGVKRQSITFKIIQKIYISLYFKGRWTKGKCGDLSEKQQIPILQSLGCSYRIPSNF
jgi:hypothetical protein